MEGRKKKTVKDGSASIKCENPMLTPAQFSEFQRQVLIFEHMKAGLPVPCHVLMPMWREVASSFGSDPSSVYNLYPSRKTDGKKWRHSRDTIPNQKYCEMQMHRGAKKRVEPKNPVPNFSIDTTSSPFLPSTMITSANADSATSDSILCISVPKSPQVATRSPSSSRCYHQ
ncbi:growth-regulating factor 12 [Citrus clementina]|uniref:growth-regulating factor 12 n=1 Tax=Citrus clementina TaxID=85681 RepID=UPI0007637991|nr:growth-regulating factor 12 [Citrus x clementina]